MYITDINANLCTICVFPKMFGKENGTQKFENTIFLDQCVQHHFHSGIPGVPKSVIRDLRELENFTSDLFERQVK